MSDAAKQESLDEIVSHSAVVLADQIQKAASWAKSEMDLQVEVAGALKEFARRAQITLEGHHNVTVATGRPDSVYGSVIVEYKDPNTLSPSKDAAPNQRLIEQLKKRFYDMRREEKRQWSSMFGVGTDGNYFIFVRFRDEKWTDQEPLEVNRHSTERFLWALYNLGQKGKPYQPEYLHGDFGSDSRLAQEGIGILYEEILRTDNPRSQVFFNQWKILFGEVCGYDVDNLSDKLKKLAEFYRIEGKPQPAQLLFAVHTYFAVLIKLLAAEIVSFFNPWMPRQVEKLQNATTSPKLRRELEQLERGGIFHDMGITNFLEGDLFSWYLAVWSESIEKLARKIIAKLDEYNPGTFSEDPAQSRDLLKKLYQQLFPKSVRHDLGEYYTPDWMAEHVLNDLGYDGDPDKRLLDPACGSGTFPVMAINRIRRWYDANREKCAYDEGELLKKILSNVIGFDLNPLAVMAARTNYLVAIKDLIRHVDHVEIPIYLCDSIMTPTEYGDLFTGGAGNVARVPCSAMKPPHLLVPKEIAKNSKDVAKYAEILETCIKAGYSPDEFVARCRDENLDITTHSSHAALYSELVSLDKQNKNGVWARIIKNNFAPLFVPSVDFVAGNPPWINWNNLPGEYRSQVAHLNEDVYNLFPHRGVKARHGSASIDISTLFVYVSVDHYLKDRGKLGFVITQTVFKSSGGSEGFRRFEIPNGASLGVYHVDDYSSVRVFENAQNRTAVIQLVKNVPTQYPVEYVEWRRASARTAATSDTDQHPNLVSTRKKAWPVQPSKKTSPWITVLESYAEVIRKVLGRSDYEAKLGVHTWLNGAYWLRTVRDAGHGLMLISNAFDAGKKAVENIDTTIEADLVYTLLRGREAGRWMSSPSLFIVVPHEPENPGSGIPISIMKEQYPKTYSYFSRLRHSLENRAGYKKFIEPAKGAFYSVYNIGKYTFEPFKVVWPEQAQSIEASVISHDKKGKLIIPDHKLTIVGVSNEEEAYFIAGALNSAPVKKAVSDYAIDIQISTHVLNYIRIPRFERKSELHLQIASISASCHKAAASGDKKRLIEFEAELDKAAAKLWDISDDELRSIYGAQLKENRIAHTTRRKIELTEAAKSKGPIAS